jgi:TolB-like protein/Flp pilus assembly protein TadD
VQAQAIANALRSLSYSVWIDSELPAHRRYTDVINEHLRLAKAVVVVWSAEAVQSDWVQSEADHARTNKKLVQVTIDGAMPPMPFDRIQCADLRDWTGDAKAPALRIILGSVTDLVGRSTATAELPPAASEPMLAVLAFDNLSGDPELAYFSDGVSEEILQTVARGADMKVFARSSSFQFRGADKAIRHVATELKATHVLDGSVRRSGTKVRISASLVECERQTTLWSDRFDRDLSDVFALQDEIAAAVAAALKTTFAPTVKREVVDPAAYNLFLKAMELRNTGLSPDSAAAVVKMLEAATVLAPKFARAWAFLATVQAARIRLESDQPYAVLRASVSAAAETALKLDPGLGSAYQALGQLEPSGHYAEREALHQKALSVSPNDPTVLTNASLFFTEIGRIREGLEFARQAYELDPMYPWVANWYANSLGYAGRMEECCALFKSLYERWPDNELIVSQCMYCAAALRDWKWFDTLEHATRDRNLDSPEFRRVISFGKVVRDPGLQIREAELARARNSLARTGAMTPSLFARFNSIGLTNECYDLVDEASFAHMVKPEPRKEERSSSDGLIFGTLWGGDMRNSIRFVGLCAKLGLCKYWAESDRWPDCAEEGVLPYDFKAECRRAAESGSQPPTSNVTATPSAL